MHIAALDDEEGVRDGLSAIVMALGHQIDCFANSQTLFEFLRQNKPDCLILDYMLQGENGISVLERLNELSLRIPVIMLSAHGDIPITVRAMSLGAVNFLEKPVRALALDTAISAAIAKSQIAPKSDPVAQSILKTLTPRERQVMDEIINGQTNAKIAEKLFIAISTVETHRKSVIEKLGTNSAVGMYLLREAAGS